MVIKEIEGDREREDEGGEAEANRYVPSGI